MKHTKTLLLTLAVILGAACQAGAAETEPEPITGSIEDGRYVIQVPVEEGDLGWAADAGEQDDTVVQLESEEIGDGYYTAIFRPVNDGIKTVVLRHYDIVCDQIHTFDLKVENGAVTESVGGSFTASPDDESLAPYILGGWVETEEKMDFMDISKNEEKGWDVEITSVDPSGMYLFRGTMYYDCDFDEFLCPYGELYEMPETTGEEEPELGEPVEEGFSGAFRFAGTDEANLKLEWLNWAEEQDPEPVVFERAIPFVMVMPQPYNIDLDALEDGIYPVAFEPENLVETESGLLLEPVEIFTKDTYDIVDIAMLGEGAVIYVDGEYITVETIEEENGFKVINGGYENGGCMLRAMDEDNCFVAVFEDDYPSFTSYGFASLELDENAVLTDSSELDAPAVTVEGAQAIKEWMKEQAEEESGFFIQLNTEIRTENGKIVEINRHYIP